MPLLKPDFTVGPFINFRDEKILSAINSEVMKITRRSLDWLTIMLGIPWAQPHLFPFWGEYKKDELGLRRVSEQYWHPEQYQAWLVAKMLHDDPLHRISAADTLSSLLEFRWYRLVRINGTRLHLHRLWRAQGPRTE
jgi:hypothetical protein